MWAKKALSTNIPLKQNTTQKDPSYRYNQDFIWSVCGLSQICHDNHCWTVTAFWWVCLDPLGKPTNLMRCLESALSRCK